MRATAPMMHIAMNCPVVMVLLLICCGPALADEWTSGDTWREAAFQSLWAIDLLQTHTIVKSELATTILICAPFAPRRPLCTPTQPYTTYSSKYHELNGFLGSHPTMGAVNRYFLVGSALHAGISYLLPEKYRVPFQYVTIAIEGGDVAYNFSLGIGIGF